MSGQSTSQTVMLALLMVVLSLCSHNAFSSGIQKLEILHKIGSDTDTYTVTAIPYDEDKHQECIDVVWPLSVQTIPGDDNGQIIHIRYLSRFPDCSLASAQSFKVQSKEHPERAVEFVWEKLIGSDTRIEFIHKDNDPYRLLSVDNSDSDKIKVWINYDG